MNLPTLSARITLLLLVTSLAILGAGSLTMDWRIDNEMEQRFEQGMLAQAQALVSPIVIEPDHLEPESSAWLSAGMLGVGSQAYYEIRCGDLGIAVSKPEPPVRPSDWPGPRSKTPRFGQFGGGWNRQLGWVVLDFDAPLGEGWGVTEAQRQSTWDNTRNRLISRDCSILLLQSRHQLNQIMMSIDWILLLGPTLALLIAFIAVPPIVRRGLRPLHALGERMRDIGPSAPGQRLPPSGIRELDPLVERFNGVLARMDEGLARERQFASGLAHETRTRLAELRALTEVERRYPSGRSMADILTELGTIGGELEATVSALLLLTRLQSGLQPPQPQALPLGPWLERISQHPRVLAAARGVQVQLQIDPAQQLFIDPALFEVALGNLLGNACAYAPAGDTVRLRIDAGGVSIDNAAPALDPADLSKLGQRFWRKQQPDPGHAGLGLALAQAAASALRWRIRFRLVEQRLYAQLQPEPTLPG
jgi:signal transduction histidine kinase